MPADHHPHWITAFVDTPAADDAAAFWCDITGGTLSPWRENQFATVLPPTGTACLRVQRFPQDRVHLDLHVEDLEAWASKAVDLGADVLERLGHIVLRSPGGFVFCLVRVASDRERPQPVTWAGHRSLVDQVTLDIPAGAWASETAFWSDLTGWPPRTLGDSEFARIDVPHELPWRLLLQRLADANTGANANANANNAGPVRAHLDLATDDRPAEIARHQVHGATVLATGRSWTVMHPPVGSVYCITDRDPTTGALGRGQDGSASRPPPPGRA